MAIVMDLQPNPTQDRCFFKCLRQLRDKLDMGALNSSMVEGHPYFKTEDVAEHEELIAACEKNKSRLGAMKIETPKNFDFLIFLGLKSKCYFKKHVNVLDMTKEKLVFKHKGIRSISHLSYEMFYKTLTQDQRGSVLEKQFKIDKFQIFASEVSKKCSNSYDNKRYYFNQYFSLPYNHSDIKVYEDKLDRNESVADFETVNPPSFIPPYFLAKYIENVHKGKYFRAEGELFDDFTKSVSNDNNLYALLKRDLEATKEELAAESQDKSQYTGERVTFPRISSEEVNHIINQSRSRDVTRVFPEDDDASGERPIFKNVQDGGKNVWKENEQSDAARDEGTQIRATQPQRQTYADPLRNTTIEAPEREQNEENNNQRGESNENGKNDEELDDPRPAKRRKLEFRAIYSDTCSEDSRSDIGDQIEDKDDDDDDHRHHNIIGDVDVTAESIVDEASRLSIASEREQPCLNSSRLRLQNVIRTYEGRRGRGAKNAIPSFIPAHLIKNKDKGEEDEEEDDDDDEEEESDCAMSQRLDSKKRMALKQKRKERRKRLKIIEKQFGSFIEVDDDSDDNDESDDDSDCDD